jgi:hypothetical protein
MILSRQFRSLECRVVEGKGGHSSPSGMNDNREKVDNNNPLYDPTILPPRLVYQEGNDVCPEIGRRKELAPRWGGGGAHRETARSKLSRFRRFMVAS